jgi:hypothetical protein
LLFTEKISGKRSSGSGTVLTRFRLFLVLGEFGNFFTLKNFLILLEEKFLDDILVFENEPLLLDIFLSLFLVDGELNFLFESTDLSLMFIFEEGEIGFGFRVMIFFPFIELLFLEFIGFALDLVGFHIVLLSCKLLLDFSEVEELWALLKVFGFLAVDLFLNGELRM